MYVIQKVGSRQFVCPAGWTKSYTTDIFKAQRYSSKEAAQREACGNEIVIRLYDLFEGD